MDVLIIPAIALIVHLMTPPPAPTPDRIILLPDAQGTVGKIVVKTGAGEQLLDKSFSSAEVGEGGQIAMATETEAGVKARYSETLAAQPQRAKSFYLYFKPGSATELTPESLETINGVMAFLAERAVPEITLIGHTDRVGSVESNDALSLKRAESARAVIERAGIKAARIDVAGRGEREPLVATADEVAEAKNRRVEINVR